MLEPVKTEPKEMIGYEVISVTPPEYPKRIGMFRDAQRMLEIAVYENRDGSCDIHVLGLDRSQEVRLVCSGHAWSISDVA